MSLNKATLIGNVGKKPEVRTTQDGREIANFSLATSERWKDKNGERKEKTEWHKIVIFTPGIVSFVKQYVNQGSKLWIEGAIQTRKWQDKEGKDHYTTEIVLQGFNCSLKLLDSKDKSENQDTHKPDYNQDVNYNPAAGGNPHRMAGIKTDADFVAEEVDDSIPF